MIISNIPQWDEKRLAIFNAYHMDEKQCVEKLLEEAKLDDEAVEYITAQAAEWVLEVRKARLTSRGIDTFLSQYALSSEEGIALMCLAEALLRIPDKETIDALIRDKLSGADWKSHLGKSESFFVNAATWALMLTGNVLKTEDPEKQESTLNHALKKLLSRTGEPVIRKAVEHGMRIMSKQFVMGRTIEEAVKRAESNEKMGYRYSYDMLGEAACTEEDTQFYFKAYSKSIQAVGQAAQGAGPVKGPGISVKLSALHPRYELAKRDRVLKELVPKLLDLAVLAKQANIAMTIDAEEANRLDLSLDVIERVYLDPALEGWEGFGIAVQSYQKRAFWVLDWIADLAKRGGRRIMVRLIKGAYWDTEIKQAQMLGLKGYPVFTRKCFTDVSFQACAKKMLGYWHWIYPQFATHNAYSVAMILALAKDYRDFEFQRLHGMGQELYDQIVPEDKLGIPCRIYAPVGSHEDLLPYLVRRLLENGANTSFVNQIVDLDKPIEHLVEDPVKKAQMLITKTANIPLPANIFSNDRKNSAGVDLADWETLKDLQLHTNVWKQYHWKAAPLVFGLETADAIQAFQTVVSPINLKQEIGSIQEADEKAIETALETAARAQLDWAQQSVSVRADCLRKAADLLESQRDELMALAMLEGGKTIPDAVAEIREAVDFCRYYADSAEEALEPVHFTGYTGETNVLSFYGRGTMLCISPWNFPLAIFIGQITACLAAGNAVIAKPAEQTPLIAYRAVTLLHQAGIPKQILQLLPGSGETVGSKLTADPRINGVLFTGSTETAKKIAQTLANRQGPIAPLVAETGGMNAMIVDSSALLQQVVQDVVTSAFGSTGQRCSALRVLYIQEEVFDSLMKLLTGALKELSVGNPCYLDTDIGPVIDKEALETLQQHIEKMKQQEKLIAQANCEKLEGGYFVAPTIVEIPDIALLKREVFGPILHVIRYQREQLDEVIESINRTGYGLTLGIHSRINETAAYIYSKAKVGNCYVNRNMIGAVVGLQPFGGEGLSGTGPKAGGPHYLHRLCVERVVTINTTATGGNAALMSQAE